jgi:hypothetical protein
MAAEKIGQGRSVHQDSERPERRTHHLAPVRSACADSGPGYPATKSKPVGESITSSEERETDGQGGGARRTGRVAGRQRCVRAEVTGCAGVPWRAHHRSRRAADGDLHGADGLVCADMGCGDGSNTPAEGMDVGSEFVATAPAIP